MIMVVIGNKILWWRTNASAEDVAYACRYLRCQPEELTEAMICACLASV